MFCQTYRCIMLACGILAVVELFADHSASADDKDKSAPSGSWVRKEGELKIEFDGKDALKICPHGDSNKIAIVCSYAVEKEGRIKVKVTGYEAGEQALEKLQKHIPVGLEFSFKWAVQEKSAKLEDLKGDGDPIAHLKEHLEGAYEKK